MNSSNLSQTCINSSLQVNTANQKLGVDQWKAFKNVYASSRYLEPSEF